MITAAGVGLWFVIGALITLGVVLLIGETVSANRRIDADVKRLRGMPRERHLHVVKTPEGLRFYQKGGYRELGADGMWEWHDGDEAGAQ